MLSTVNIITDLALVVANVLLIVVVVRGWKNERR